jgi:hypothetical protein
MGTAARRGRGNRWKRSLAEAAGVFQIADGFHGRVVIVTGRLPASEKRPHAASRARAPNLALVGRNERSSTGA